MRQMDSSEMLPREKAMELGVKSLSDKELMAVIFGTGTQGKNVFQLCDEVLGANDGHLSLVAKTEWRDFIRQFKGVGPAKALTLLAALELGARAGRDALTVRKIPMTTSRRVYEYMLPEFIGLDHEQFWVLLLNNCNNVIKKVKIGQGGFNTTVVDVRIIMREAILAKASAMVALHNHPSGNLTPSMQDIQLTCKIREAADIFGIRLLDHVIVCDSDFYSFNDSGKMP